MGGFADKLMAFGMWVSNNKYLGAIRDAFQEFMPFTIIGAIGTLWTSVIVNSSTGLGALIPAVMGLEFLNPIFSALNFATIGCISLAICFAIGMEIGKRNGMKGYYCGLIALAGLIVVVGATTSADSVMGLNGEFEYNSFGAFVPGGIMLQILSSDVLGASGLFTAMIVGILTVELLGFFNKFEKLQIKLPDAVPPNIAASFNALIPSTLTLLTIGAISFILQTLTGSTVHNLVFNLVQVPLQNVGGSFAGGLIFVIVISVFWCFGLHGNNMVGSIMTPIMTAMMIENEEAVRAGLQATHILNGSFMSCFVTFVGTGIAGAITIAIFLVGKREDNRSIAKLSAFPNCFNINETVVFGLPVVLNPIMCIGFIIAPIVSYTLAYVLTAIGFCPIMYVNVPWTTPPVIAGFLASGGNIMGAVTQLICLVAAVLVYIPCIKLYERQQNAQDAKNNA
ncbi:MAG: PTS sugar transporter subunit IIC [Solobacterium sp.]|nr:PTS sugar transporter subunit IIC [Solobacterium sp.]